MAGRPAKPIELHLLNGNKRHLTKAEIEQRKKSEVKLGEHKLVCPSYVRQDKNAYKKWKEIVKLYTGELPIFDNFGVTKQIKSLFGRTVTYKGGAYLIIEHTEAMHVIDVNSGNRVKGNTEQEKTAFNVNIAAAEEIARQLRLRDMGGIIVIDFIDLTEASNRQQLFAPNTTSSP